MERRIYHFCGIRKMAGLPKEYIKSIIPDGMKKGADLLQEGIEIGKTFEAQYPKYYLAKGYKTISEHNARLAEEDGFAGFSVNIGMATRDETLNACLSLHEWSKEIGVKLVGGYILPSMQVGVPKDKRDREMDTTSFMMETPEDYAVFNREEIYLPLSNFNVVCPNAIETTSYSLMAGLNSLGTTSQLSWDYPGCDDHMEIVENVCRALGIIQSKKEYGPGLCCYVEDGLSGCCVDTVSYAAAFLLDQYLYSKLCGIDISVGFGALVSDVRTRAALMKALNDLAAEEGSNLSFVHANTTTQWDHDVNANFGPSCQEMLMTFLAEDRFKTGAELQTVPVTEAVTVPTEQELKDILAASSRVAEFVDQWRELIDWTEIENRAEIIKREGRKMFNNILKNLEESGADIKDPLKLLKFIKDVDSALFEQAYHPSVQETGIFTPWYPNDMGQLTMDEVDAAVNALKEKGYSSETLKGKRILIGSTDVHAYGVRFVNSVLTALGAEIVDIGVDNSVLGMLDTAMEEGIQFIGVSTHSGNALAVGNYFEQYIKEKERDCKVFMGGILTSILPGHSEPSQVADLLNKNDNILATNDIELSVRFILEN